MSKLWQVVQHLFNEKIRESALSRSFPCATEFVAPMSIMDKRRGRVIRCKVHFEMKRRMQMRSESRIGTHPIGNERVITDDNQQTALWVRFERRLTMFKFIGAAVVYGFAAFGLSKFLESISDDASESSG